MPGLSVRWKAPISRFSSTVMRPNRRRPSGDWATPALTICVAERRVRSSPSNWMVPLRGRSRPEIVFSVVDLPAPFAPSSVTISPSPTASDTPLRAWIAP